MWHQRDIAYIETTADYKKEWISYCSLGSHFCENCFLRFKCYTTRNKKVYLNEIEWNKWKNIHGMCLGECKFIGLYKI